MSDFLVLNRQDFYAFANALNNFPDWPKVMDWVRANEVIAPPDLPTVDEVAESAVTLADIATKLDTILSALQETAQIGEVFQQFGSMMGMNGAPPQYNPHDTAVPAGIQILSRPV